MKIEINEEAAWAIVVIVVVTGTVLITIFGK